VRPTTFSTYRKQIRLIDGELGTIAARGATWAVSVEFANGGAWTELTGEAACAPPGDPRRRVAIVLDGEVLTSPQVGAEVACQIGIQGGSTVITGQFAESDKSWRC